MRSFGLTVCLGLLLRPGNLGRNKRSKTCNKKKRKRERTWANLINSNYSRECIVCNFYIQYPLVFFMLYFLFLHKSQVRSFSEFFMDEFTFTMKTWKLATLHFFYSKFPWEVFGNNKKVDLCIGLIIAFAGEEFVFAII